MNYTEKLLEVLAEAGAQQIDGADELHVLISRGDVKVVTADYIEQLKVVIRQQQNSIKQLRRESGRL